MDYFVDGEAFEFGEFFGDIDEVAGFGPIASIFLEGLGGGVGLQNYGIEGEDFGDLLEFGEAEEGLRQGDAEAEVNGFAGGSFVALEVVHDAADGVGTLLAEGLEDFGVGLAGVEDDGFFEFEGELNLGAKGLELDIFVGGSGEEVEADFGYADDLGVVLGEGLEFVVDFVGNGTLEIGGVESDAGVDGIVLVGEGDGVAGGDEGGAGADHELDVGIGGAAEDAGDFCGFVVVEVGVGVY